VLSYPAPPFVQLDDEDLVLEIGAVMFPGKITRSSEENGLRLWVDGTEPGPELASDARALFQTALGVLRAWRPSAGELAAERLVGLGPGTVRNEQGDQWVLMAPVISQGTGVGELRELLEPARKGIDDSSQLANALWLFGRTSLSAADFYMIHEYAVDAFGGTKGITAALGLSGKSQDRLTKSANNLSPVAGGRHYVRSPSQEVMPLEEQREYIGLLLRRWISRHAARAASKAGPAPPQAAP
jgi:hypothetical protein